MKSERQLIALCQLKPEVTTLLKIKPEYLQNEKARAILKMMIDSFKKYGYLKLDNLGAFTGYYYEILSEELIVESQWKEVLKATQEEVLVNYKKRIVKKLVSQLENEKIDYDEFNEKIESLKELKIEDEVHYLTEKEIRENLFLKSKKIVINKFPKLERKLNLVENDLLIVGASTGVGKTSFLLNLLETLSEKYQCIYFNLEMAKTQMYRRLVGITSEQKINDIDNPNEYQKVAFANAIKLLDNKKIVFEHDKFEIKDVVSTVAKAKDINKHTIVFIDHIGLLRAKKFNSSYERMTAIMKELRQITQKYNCTIICASQLNRTAMSSDDINISMLKDSGEVENSARKIILLYQKEQDEVNNLRPIVNCEIAKNDSGLIGIIETIYDKQTQIFKER